MPDDVDNIFEKEILNELLGKVGEKPPEKKCTFLQIPKIPILSS